MNQKSLRFILLFFSLFRLRRLLRSTSAGSSFAFLLLLRICLETVSAFVELELDLWVADLDSDLLVELDLGLPSCLFRKDWYSIGLVPLLVAAKSERRPRYSAGLRSLGIGRLTLAGTSAIAERR